MEQMEGIGYSSDYLQCGPDARTKIQWRQDGVGIFYNTEKFRQVGETRKQYLHNADGKECPQAAMFIRLRNKEATGETGEFVACVAHLRAGKGAKNDALRDAQVKHIQEILKSKYAGLPVVFGVDLNTTPTTTDGHCYPTLKKGELFSAYSKCNSYFPGRDSKTNEPAHTTWKTRVCGNQPAKNGKTFKQTSDYIFLSEGRFRVLGLLDFPPAEAMETCLMPGYKYPSDHFAVMAEVELLCVS